MDKVIKNFQNISYGPAPEDSKEVNSWIKNLNNPNSITPKVIHNIGVIIKRNK